jgi:uncharacterized protein (DUF983 family)
MRVIANSSLGRWSILNMAKAASCPQCEASSEAITLIFGRTSYCVGCGWNCEAAKVEIRTELLSMVAVSVIALVLSAFVGFKNPETHWMAAAILVAALAVPLCNGIPAYRRMRKLKSLTPPTALKTPQ